MDINMYEAQANSVDVDDIATDSNNRIVMRRTKRNNADEDVTSLFIQNRNEYYEDSNRYVPEGADDMGWLGYFIGKNYHLKSLCIDSFIPTSGASVRDVLDPFFRGVGRNKSIRELDLPGADLLGGEVFTMLGSFFRDNHNLTKITITRCDFGDEGARLFALALGSSTHKSLKKVSLENNDISEEGIVDIITSLSMHPHLNCLDLEGNHLRTSGCVALATLLRYSTTELEYLYLSNNEINDEGIEALVPALTTCRHLQWLYVDNNPSIITRGWQSLASILEAPNSNLEKLFIANNNTVDDEAVAAFASALMGNRTLQSLYLDDSPSITAIGWEAFSKLLCNTSSVNSTFLSNHTLRQMGREIDENEIIGPLLRLNVRNNKTEVTTIKILQSHEDFDMLPFFEWEFKVLPLVLSWLERASEYNMPEDFEPNIEGRKLSTIYQFVGGMPLLYVETRLRKELEDLKAEESQLEEEQLKLQQEFHQRKQLLQERKELLEERKKSITKRIGKPNLN